MTRLFVIAVVVSGFAVLLFQKPVIIRGLFRCVGAGDC